MEEIGSNREDEILSSKQRLDACDLLCFVYDTSDVNSFEYVASLRVSKSDHAWMSMVYLYRYIGKVQGGSYTYCICSYKMRAGFGDSAL